MVRLYALRRAFRIRWLLYEFLLGFCKIVGAGIDVVTIRAQPYLVV